jgi:hypothetical protein
MQFVSLDVIDSCLKPMSFLGGTDVLLEFGLVAGHLPELP